MSNTANIGINKVNGAAAKDVIDTAGPTGKWIDLLNVPSLQASLSPVWETDMEWDKQNVLAIADFAWLPIKVNQSQYQRAIDHAFSKNTSDYSKLPPQGDFSDPGTPKWGWNFEIHAGVDGGRDVVNSPVKSSKTGAVVGYLPPFWASRFAPELKASLQYRQVEWTEDFAGLYLFQPEQSYFTDSSQIVHFFQASGWKGANTLGFSYSPEGKNAAFTLKYQDGFSAPKFNRANGVTFGVTVKY